MRRVTWWMTAMMFCFFAGTQHGCFQNGRNNPNGAITAIESSDGSSVATTIRFAFILSEVKETVIPNIMAAASSTPIVTFKLNLVNPGNVGQKITTLTKMVPVDLVTRTAHVTFSGIPPVTCIGDVHIDGGKIGSFTDFHGAKDLLAGVENIIEVAPKGLKSQQDIVAEIVYRFTQSNSMFAFVTNQFASRVTNAIASLDLQSQSVYDDAVNLTFNTFGIPSAPKNLHAVGNSGAITLTWGIASGATSYNVYWSTTASVTKTNGTLLRDKASGFIHNGLFNGTTYYYVITAVNENGESIESSQVVAIPMLLPPAAPKNVFVTSGWSGNSFPRFINVSWDSIASAESYSLYWSLHPGLTTKTGTKIENVTSKFKHSDLQASTTYYYILTYISQGVESEPSTEASATTYRMAEIQCLTLTPAIGTVTVQVTDLNLVKVAAEYDMGVGTVLVPTASITWQGPGVVGSTFTAANINGVFEISCSVEGKVATLTVNIFDHSGSPFRRKINGVITDSRNGLEWYEGLDDVPTPVWVYFNDPVEGWRNPTTGELLTLFNATGRPGGLLADGSRKTIYLDLAFQFDRAYYVWATRSGDPAQAWGYSFTDPDKLGAFRTGTEPGPSDDRSGFRRFLVRP